MRSSLEDKTWPCQKGPVGHRVCALRAAQSRSVKLGVRPLANVEDVELARILGVVKILATGLDEQDRWVRDLFTPRAIRRPERKDRNFLRQYV